MLQNDMATRDNVIFAGYLSKCKRDARKRIPGEAKQLPELNFWKCMHQSQYILSPNGDRIECHHHYEAIGMSAMPITLLDPWMHRHLRGNVIFDKFKWNLTELDECLPCNPIVNR